MCMSSHSETACPGFEYHRQTIPAPPTTDNWLMDEDLQALGVEDLRAKGSQLSADGEEKGVGITPAQEVVAVAADEVAGPLGMGCGQVGQKGSLAHAIVTGEDHEAALGIVKDGIDLLHQAPYSCQPPSGYAVCIRQ